MTDPSAQLRIITESVAFRLPPRRLVGETRNIDEHKLAVERVLIAAGACDDGATNGLVEHLSFPASERDAVWRAAAICVHGSIDERVPLVGGEGAAYWCGHRSRRLTS